MCGSQKACLEHLSLSVSELGQMDIGTQPCFPASCSIAQRRGGGGGVRKPNTGLRSEVDVCLVDM